MVRTKRQEAAYSLAVTLGSFMAPGFALPWLILGMALAVGAGAVAPELGFSAMDGVTVAIAAYVGLTFFLMGAVVVSDVMNNEVPRTEES